MSSVNVGEKIVALIAKQMNKGADAVSADSRIVEDLKADSLDVVEMLMTIEEEFGVQIPDEEAMKMKTINDLIVFVEKNI